MTRALVQVVMHALIQHITQDLDERVSENVRVSHMIWLSNRYIKKEIDEEFLSQTIVTTQLPVKYFVILSLISDSTIQGRVVCMIDLTSMLVEQLCTVT